MKGRLLALGLAACCCGLFSCAGPAANIHIETSRPQKPAWAQGELLPPDGFMYFLGTALGVNSLQEGRKQAMDAALAQAAEYIGTSIEADAEQHDGTTGSKRESRIKTKTKALITRAEAEEMYTERTRRFEAGLTLEFWDVYLLVKVPRLNLWSAQKDLAAEREQRLDHVFAELQQAQALLAQKKALLAFQRAKDAQKNLAAIAGPSAQRAQLQAEVEKIYEQARRAATSFTSLVTAPSSAMGSAFQQALEAALSSKGFQPVARIANISTEKIKRIVEGGRFDVQGALHPSLAFVVLSSLRAERGGMAFGQQAIYLYTRLQLIDPQTGDILFVHSQRTREFGQSLEDAERVTAMAAGEAAAAAVAERLK
jgi:hypothetical protein